MQFKFWLMEFISHNGVPMNAVWLIYTMAGIMGRVNHRADNVNMINLVLKMQILKYAHTCVLEIPYIFMPRQIGGYS